MYNAVTLVFDLERRAVRWLAHQSSKGERATEDLACVKKKEEVVIVINDNKQQRKRVYQESEPKYKSSSIDLLRKENRRSKKIARIVYLSVPLSRSFTVKKKKDK